MALTQFVRSSCMFQKSLLPPSVMRFSTVITTPTIHRKHPEIALTPNLTKITMKFSPAMLQFNRNLSVTTPKLSSATGNHTTLWSAERILSVSLLGVIPIALLFPCQPLDAALAISVVMHQHWGLEAAVVDYIRPTIFGNVIPKVSHGLLMLISAATLGGLLYFIYTDIGIAKSIRKLWSIKGQ